MTPLSYSCIYCGDPANHLSCQQCHNALCSTHATTVEDTGLHYCRECLETNQDETTHESL